MANTQIPVLPLSKSFDSDLFTSLTSQGCTFIEGRVNPKKARRYIPATPAGVSPTNPGEYALRNEKDLKTLFDPLLKTYTTVLPPITMIINGAQSADIIALDLEHNDHTELAENLDFFRNTLGINPYNTFSVITAGAGLHIYLRLKPGSSHSFKRATAMRPGMDFLGEGGTASSPLCAGYEVLSNTPIQNAPDSLYEWYVDTQKARKPSGSAASAADMTHRALIKKDIPEGERNSYLFSLGCKWAYTLPANDPGNFDILYEMLVACGQGMQPPYTRNEETEEIESIARRALEYSQASRQAAQISPPASSDPRSFSSGLSVPIANLAQYDAARFKDLPIDERGVAHRLQHVWDSKDPQILFLESSNSFWAKQRVWQDLPRPYVTIQNILLEIAAADSQAGQNQDINKKLKTKISAHASMNVILESLKQHLSFPFNSLDHEARNWIGFSNGALNIRTREFLAACPPGVSATSLVSYAYQNPEETQETPSLQAWDYLLKTMFPNDPDLQAFIPILLGYCLLGTNADKKFFLFIGVQDAGKSTLMRLIQKLFGEVMCKNINTKIFASNKETSEATRGAALIPAKESRIVIASEVGNNAYLKEEDIKVMTGGDEIQARYAYSREVTAYTPKFVPLMTGNDDPPFFSAASGALKIRLTKIPLKVIVTPEMRALRPDLEEELDQELPQIFNLVLDGMQTYLDSKKSINALLPLTVVEATNRFFDEADVFRQFFTEELDIFEPEGYSELSTTRLREQHKTPAHNLKAAFLAYQEHFMQGELQSKLTITSLGKRLRDSGAEKVRTNGVYYWKGVKLKTPKTSTNKMVLTYNTVGLIKGPIMVTFGEEVPPHLTAQDNNGVISKTPALTPNQQNVVPIK